ncbi:MULTISPECIES: DoxX family protein [unclassified Herbaspirillum]|uniref:DoxX family protein n=1 Tax=unclassified Herbaspirillum TaxID=2624150 RepID=UPI001154DCE5|nr:MULTISPECIES: DoxX family protein [unclassified Herbaspirillum]MBB5393336.1 putative oxidoreductase [Herbaspirillum sp. SJZ102]TQK03915.1 putative oxidoreductase [Herbaspirillum sp. SJZ130]TQK08647.1 putative oxidoreductase [Herbaspirillum sp. SJZ106]TWC71918.1 putative oxidoreductase [Herbaspirillum sp. SJZ099]
MITNINTYRIGRILLASLFVISGIFKILGFSGTVGYFTSLGLPVPTLAVIVTILVEVGGGLLLMFGRGVKPVSLVIALFTVGATLSAHHFWTMEGAAAQAQLTQFLKNLSLIGALLLVSSIDPEAQPERPH